ncbi:transcriptional regulator nodulation protein NodD 3 (plasmid) [Rhizobium etli]|uniref:Transcriptional regulator nodulation protein NodD 3 n=1 Tax=Rhizobium etli TaxID=29449 RepID=A0AAN1BLI5_RHIET|nr:MULTISPECIES: LysR family transcriptional regulator [Rhizobium]ARO32478.1 transcriptional regulator nodulation protein NodD 1 [Rhizobium sp. NXC14]ARQ13460.1 transcriptional regulator nodulation protein NodD 3 [Rhizobium etli]
MRFKGLDLNLLVVLDALMTERNLTAAARSINLSQPAMSAAVARLRTYFRDDLFTRAGRELVPSPRAEELAPAVREALQNIQLSIISWEPFDPAKSDRTFRIIVSDYVTLVFFERVIERVAREAPAVSFDFLSLSDDYDELLRRGEIDFLIMPDVFMSKNPHTALFEDRFVCVGCCTNKQLSQPLTLEQYISMGHVAFKFGNLRKPTIEEWWLAEHGLNRRIEVVVQGFSMIPSVVSGTERLGTIPLRLAQHFARTIPLKIVELPVPFPVLTEAIQWPVLHNCHPASVWMREILMQEASRMISPDVTAKPLNWTSAGSDLLTIYPRTSSELAAR